jgi:hypothetical protein
MNIKKMVPAILTIAALIMGSSAVTAQASLAAASPAGQTVAAAVSDGTGCNNDDWPWGE